jgi:hypothetical protein
LAQLADRRHHFGGVAPKPVDAGDHDGIAGPGVVEQRGQAGPLLAGRGAAELVGVDPCRVHPGGVQSVGVGVDGLMAGGHAGVPEQLAGRCGCGEGVDRHASSYLKSQ